MSPASHAVKFLRESYRRVLSKVLRKNAEAFAYPGFEGLEPRLLMNAAPEAGNDQFATWIERVSVSSNGVQGDQASYGGATSADGRYVAFESDASNLAAGDTNGAKDIFVRDRLTGATERVSVSSSGEQANGASGAPSISADGRYVLFESVGSNLVSGDTNGRIDIFVHDRQTGTTQRVTVSSNGVEQNGDSQDGRISGDGRYAVFASYATNLVPGGADRHSDIFVRDLQAGTTEEVSVSSRGVPGSQGSYRPSISADGRYVTFTSYASLLVPGDRNSAYDVFVRDRVAGTTTLVDGGAGASYTDPTTGLVFPTASQYHPSVSADGRHVAFDTDAWTPTSENDTNNGVLDVFVHDQQTDTTRRISVSTTGGDTDGASSMPSITRDGRYVVFRSYATNLVPDDTNGVSDLFAYDLVTGTMRRLSESAAGTQGNGGSSSLLSSGLAGPYAAFGSEAANLTPGDTNGVADTYFVRLAPGATDEDTALRITSDRFLANDTDPDEDTLAVSEVSGTSQYGATVTLNEDGSITYDPSGSDYLHGLAAGDMANDTFSYTVSDGHGGTATATVTLTVAGVDDPTDGSDLQNTRGFLGDSSYNTNSNTALTAGNDTLSTQIERVDASVGEGISDRSSAVTPDGRYVAFESASMAGGNGFSNIYLYDRQLNTTILVSVTPDGTTLGNADSYSPSISADGRYVAFSSQASNLDARDEQGCSNVFVYDRETQQVQLVSVGSDGATPGNGDSLSPSISADGQYVAFASGATNLIAAGSRGIFVRDLAAETTELASVTSPDAYGKQDPATGFNSRPVISADGRYVAFQSTATNLGDSHAGWFGNIYVHDRETGSTQWVTARTTSTVPATGFMYLDGISADGQSVVFDSGATNLVVSSTPSTYPSWSVYVARLDESAWTVSRVSLGDFESESQYYIASSRGQITSDGRYVVFEAYTTERGTPGAWDVLVADLAPEGATIRLSELAGGDALNGSTRMSQGPATIGDYAVLWSDATDLVPGDANGGLFVARLAPGATDANTPMRIRASLLLANDGGDSPTITDVTYTGEYEASVTLNEEDGSITYDPTDSTVFKALAAGDTREDTFTYDVSDGENGTLTNTVTVTVAGVNDAPVADNVELSVDENAADNDVVGQVTARDPDTGDTLTYAITGGNKDGVFAIDSSGHIRVADHTKLSYDATAAYALTVTVKDGKNLSGTATVAILVNDVASNHSPVVYAAELHVDENSGSGTVVGRAIAWDVDAGDTLTYAITGTAFAIDSTTGLITVTGTTQLHYDTASSYQLTVTVTDNHNASVTAAETILVNDVSNNHYPSVAGTTFYVNSDSAVGTVVGRVMASDADANDRLTYAITGGNTDDAFTIDSQTGDLIVHDVAPLWAESTFGLTVAVTDRDNQTSTVTVTVLVDASNSSGGTPGLHGINGFQVQGSGDNVELSWNGVAGAVGYNVYKWDGTDWGYLDSTDSQTRTYTDTYAEEDHHYGANEIYYVAAVNGLGAVIAASPPQTGTTAPQVLAEDDLDLTATDDGHGHLELQWSPVQGAQQYEIHRKTKSGDIWVEDGDPIGYVYDAVKFVDMHCTENTRYRYSIIASYTINDVGQVGWSGMSADSGEAWVARSEYEKTLEYADLAIDSDNTSDAGPQQDGYEEATENTQGLPGKIIVVNDAYRNDNNIPDFAEPTALDTSSLVPMVFRIHYPGWMLGNVLWKDTFLNHHWVTFNYNAASAAAQVGTAPDDNPAYAIAGGDVSKGAYRLWLPSEKNPSSPVARSTLTFIDANEVRSLASLGFGCSGEYDSVTLYVEAVRPSAALGDTIEVLGDNYDDLNICGTPSATSLQKSIDTIRVTAVQDMDANAYSGLVRLADGTVSLTETDFASNAYGMPWGATRTFTNDPVLSLNKLNGNGWSDLPYLIQGTSTMMVVQGGSARYFDKVMDAVGNGFHYEGRFDTLANLTKIVDTFTGDSSYKLTEADGSTWSFCGFGNTIAPYPLYQRGAFQQYVGPGGDSVGVTSRTVDGKPLMIARGVETFRYAYDAADGETTDAGKLRRVTLERLISGSAAKAIESVRYDYDTSGNLTKAIVSRSVTPDANSPEAMTDLDTFTYTYDARSNGETADNAIRLLTATEPDTNARSNHSAPDYSFTYDDDRVDTQAVLGAGASGGNTVGTFTYNYYRADYDTRANADGSGVGINAWRMRTTVDSPDGAEQRVYTNFAGQQMVSEVGGGWRTFTRYDRAGRVILSAQPSAVSCLFQSRSDLLYMVSGHYELLKDDIGLITRYTYGTGASSDQPKGYLIETALLKGERDSAPDLQKTIRYTSDTPIPVVYTEKAYKSDDGNNGVTTYYTYPHWTGCVPTTVTTTLPDVSGQNGSAANTFTTCSDSYGRVIWSKDGNGTLSCTGYDDERNGAVDLSVADVDTSLEGFDSGPFTSTAGTHLHLTTTIRADDLGRPMEITDSAGRKTTFTYYDSASQSSVWSMLVDTADDNPPPRQYTITDRAAGTVAAGTASRTSDTKYSKSETVYDAGGRVSKQRRYTDPNSTSSYYESTTTYNTAGLVDSVTDEAGTVTTTEYDLLGRRINVKAGIAAISLISEYQYDNGGVGDGTLTRVTTHDDSGAHEAKYTYDYRGRQLSDSDPNSPIAGDKYDNFNDLRFSETYVGSTLRNWSEVTYDDLGRPYKTVTTADTLSTQKNHTLTSQVWHDADGRVVKTQDANGLFTKTKYDSLGRIVATYTGYNDSASDVDVISSDTIIQQTETIYDKKGNSVATLSFSRFPSVASGGGKLTAANSYATAVIRWYDYAGRLIGTADFGREDIHANSAWPRHVFALATGYLIDTDSDGIPDVAATPLEPTTANDDYIATKIEYNAQGMAYRTTDNASRVTQTTFDALGRATAVVENHVDGVAGNGNPDEDRKTVYVYGSGDRLLSQTAFNPKAATVEAQVTRYQYESVENASWRTGVVSPDGSTQTTQYDPLGRVISMIDARGVQHEYKYDGAGRVTLDKVTNLGATDQKVDGSIRAIKTIYDELGRVATVTSYHNADGTGVANQVAYAYDGWGNVMAIAQSHDGTVPGNNTRWVWYAYDDGAGAGTTALYNRLSSVTYPDGTVVTYDYGSGVTDKMSLVASITDTHAPSGLPDVAYSYLGAGTIVKETHLAAGGGLTLDYNPGAGNAFSGWDRFGRVADQKWVRETGPTVLDEYTYTYDKAGNVKTKNNEVHTAFNETYDYDKLNRLTRVLRGPTGSQTQVQNWALDQLGNWTSTTTTGGTETRAFGPANQITKINNVETATTYDKAGNLTAGPTPGKPAVKQYYVYDAWNRLIGVYSDANHTTAIATYAYDGLGQRIQKTAAGVTSHYYYNANWQVVEVRKDSDPDPLETYVWDLSYVDAPVLRYRDGNTDGDYLDTADNVDTKLFYLTDANHNVTMLVHQDTGYAAERYLYDPYGNVTVLTPSYDPLSASAVGNSVLFTGQRFDSESGLYLYRHRTYDPSLGRFLQRDPEGDVDGANLYQYTDSNPVDRVDSNGLFWSEFITLAIMAVDTVQFFAGSIKGKEYAQRMAINVVCLGADVLTGGFGGGLAARGALMAPRAFKVARTAFQVADVAVNVYQAGSSAAQARDNFSNGEIGSGLMNLADAGLRVLHIKMRTSQVLKELRYASGEAQALSRGAQLRAKYGATFDEYTHFRGQGFTPAQAKYLTKPYDGWGHHFLSRSRAGRWGVPECITESSLNVMKPQGISIGRFYERHFLADPYFNVARFPKAIGGNWEASMTGLQRPGFVGRLWYGSPQALKVTVGGAAAAGGAAGVYWWMNSGDE